MENLTDEVVKNCDLIRIDKDGILWIYRPSLLKALENRIKETAYGSDRI
ncbi:hypothetical protein J8281_03495 [Aquimarina sp. U1-2]|nr:hypothetical protein [Aquimarina sp. U1-2]MBP2831242.1 hypothetical protein [Aquimarina sp. U1-2]